MRKPYLYLALFLLCGISTRAQWNITASNTSFTQNFDGMGGGTTLPAGFQIISPRSAAIGSVDFAVNAGGISGTATGAAYNYGAGSDQAIGVLNSGSYTSGKYVILQITNTTGSTINNIALSWNYEKYRNGARSWTWNFYHGPTTGANINVAAGNYTYAADGENNTNQNPPQSVPASVNITGLNIPAGSSYYFRWVLTGAGGSTNGQGLAIDNVVINCSSACPVGTPVIALGNDVSFCHGSPFSLTLNAQNPGATYDWNNGAASTQTYAVTGAGTYMVKVTDANGCINRDTLTVTENALPVLNLGADTSYCAGTPFNLTLDAQNPGSTYNWNNGAASSQTFAVTTAGTYSVTVTDAHNCESTDQLTVTEKAVPVVNLGNDTAFCAGTPFVATLNAQNPGASFNWDNGAAFTQMYMITSAGIYSVTVTGTNGCQTTDQIVIAENVLPSLALGNDTAYCAGTPFSLTLDAGNVGATYNWNNGTASTQNYTATTAGTYSVTVTDSNGCAGTDQLVVTEYALPIVDLGSDTSYCIGSPFVLLLDAENIGATYSWNGGGLTAQIFAVSQAGTYSVLVTNGNGCTASDAVTVTENPLPTVDIEDNTFFCTGTAFSMILDAGNPGSTYNWNNGAANTQTYTVSSAGNYTVTVTDANGCSNSDSMTITAMPLPVVDLGNDTAYCAGTAFSLVLNAQNPGASYSWNGGVANTQTYVATEAGTYTVNVTDVFGCSSSHSITITENAQPNLDLGSDITTNNSSQVLNAGTGFSSYQWFPGGQTTAQITVTQSGEYSVSITNGNGCTASDTIQVTFVNTASVSETALAGGLSVFPNPSAGMLYIKLDEDGPLNLNVLTLGGQSVYSRNLPGTGEQTLELDLSHLAAGLYLLQVSGNGHHYTQRIVLTR